MVWAQTINNNGIPEFAGRHKVVTGTFTDGNSGGEDINTGLRRVLFFSAQLTGSAPNATAPVINETFPLESGDVTLVATDDDDGIWMAIGE